MMTSSPGSGVGVVEATGSSKPRGSYRPRYLPMPDRRMEAFAERVACLIMVPAAAAAPTVAPMPHRAHTVQCETRSTLSARSRDSWKSRKTHRQLRPAARKPLLPTKTSFNQPHVCKKHI
jgi:hypothetical protein